MTIRPAPKLERSLASLLHYGTLFASLLMAAGVVLGAFTPGAGAASRLVTLGVGVVIVLPACRLLLMAAAYLAARDYRFAGIAAVVLAIVVVSCVVGLRLGVAAG